MIAYRLFYRPLTNSEVPAGLDSTESSLNQIV